MKRILALVVSLIMLVSLSACSRKAKTSPDGLEPGTYTSTHPQFAQLRQKYFDYFWNLFGAKFLVTNSKGTYDDEDVLSFVFIYMSRGLGEDTNNGVTKKRLNEIAQQYAGHTITEFNTDCSQVNEENGLVYPTTFNPAIGDLLVLQSMIIREDGTHDAMFNRCVLSEDFWRDRDEQETLQNIATENYDDLGEGIAVYPTRVVFTVHLDKNDNEYLRVTTMRNVSYNPA